MKKKLTNENKIALLTLWSTNVDSRTNEYYYVSAQISKEELMQLAFEQLNILIQVESVDSLLSKITFIDILN